MANERLNQGANANGYCTGFTSFTLVQQVLYSQCLQLSFQSKIYNVVFFTRALLISPSVIYVNITYTFFQL